MRSASTIPSVWRRVCRLAGRLGDRRGVAAIELALASPVLLVLLIGTTELASFIKIHYQSAQMASTVADAVARYDKVTSADIADILSASAAVMDQTDFGAKGYVVLTSAVKVKATDAPTVAWQCRGGGTTAQASRVGKLKGVATLPGSLVLDADDNVIVAEVFYTYTPMFTLIPIDTRIVYKTAVFRPRLGALTTVSGC